MVMRQGLRRGAVVAGAGPSGGVVGDTPADAGRVRQDERGTLDIGCATADAGRNDLGTAGASARACRERDDDDHGDDCGGGQPGPGPDQALPPLLGTLLALHLLQPSLDPALLPSALGHAKPPLAGAEGQPAPHSVPDPL